MKIKDIAAMVAVIVTAGGCTSNDEVKQPGESVPIKLAATIAPAENTRGTVPSVSTRAFGDWGGSATTQDTELLMGETVRAWISENDGSHTAAIKNPIEYTVADPTTADAPGDLEPVTDTTPFYYPIGVDVISIHAIHPSGYDSGTKFTVNLDQTTEANYAASDLCYSLPADFTRANVVNGRKLLQMKHLLSKIVINLTLDNNVTGASLPSSIKLHAKTSTTMTYPVAVTTDANGYTGCTASDASDPGVITMKQEAIIPPQTIAAGASFISFSVTGLGPMIYPMPDATTFESGKRYTYNIRVKNVGIDVTTNVTDWGTKTTEVVMANKIRRCRLNPLWYVAPSNVKSYNSSTKVVTLESNPASGGSYQMYKWSDAMTYFAKQTTSYNEYWSGSTITDGSSNFKYHLPSLNEWYSIISALGNIIGSTPWLSEGGLAGPVGCVFGYNDETKIGVSDWSYWSPTTGTVTARYAIRYLGTEYCSVWKYENIGYTVVITSKLIDCLEKDDPTLGTKLSTYIGNTTFWSTIDEEKGDVQRTFYYSGYVNKSGSGGTGAADSQKETHGHCWSTTQVSSNADNAWYFYIYNLPYICVNNYGKKFGFSVRLFRNDD